MRSFSALPITASSTSSATKVLSLLRIGLPITQVKRSAQLQSKSTKHDISSICEHTATKTSKDLLFRNEKKKGGGGRGNTAQILTPTASTRAHFDNDSMSPASTNKPAAGEHCRRVKGVVCTDGQRSDRSYLTHRTGFGRCGDGLRSSRTFVPTRKTTGEGGENRKRVRQSVFEPRVRVRHVGCPRLGCNFRGCGSRARRGLTLTGWFVLSRSARDTAT